jgi:hypothetical protein
MEGGLTDRVSLAVGGVDETEDGEALVEASLPLSPPVPPQAEIATAIAAHKR